MELNKVKGVDWEDSVDKGGFFSANIGTEQKNSPGFKGLIEVVCIILYLCFYL